MCKNLRSGTDRTDGRHERHTDVSMDDTHTDVRMDDTTTTHIIRTPGHLCHPERSLVHTAECRVGFCQTNMHTRFRRLGWRRSTNTHTHRAYACGGVFVRPEHVKAERMRHLHERMCVCVGVESRANWTRQDECLICLFGTKPRARCDTVSPGHTGYFTERYLRWVPTHTHKHAHAPRWKRYMLVSRFVFQFNYAQQNTPQFNIK